MPKYRFVGKADSVDEGLVPPEMLESFRVTVEPPIKRDKNPERLYTFTGDFSGLEPVPDPDPDPEPETGNGLPTATREVNIARGGELQEALNSVDPGTHLVLHPDGDYSGVYTLKRPGTIEAPIFVRGAKGAPVKFGGSLKLPAAWTAVALLRFAGGGRKVEIGEAGGRVTRCLFDGVDYDGMVYMVGKSHPYVRIDHNDFVNIGGAAVRCELEDGSKHQHMRFDHNHVKGHRVRGDNESVIIILTDAFHDSYLRIDNNLLDGCLKGATDQREITTVKTGKTYVVNNTILDCNNGHISLRETSRCLVEGNWFEEGSYISVYGDDHVFDNNRSTGKLIEANRGDAYVTQEVPNGCESYMKSGRTTIIKKNGKCVPAHCAGRRLLFMDNIGEIHLGGSMSSRDAGSSLVRGVELLRNDRPAKISKDGCVDVKESNVGEHQNTARKLTPADVGVDAPY